MSYKYEFIVESIYKKTTYVTGDYEDAMEWYDMYREYGEDTVTLTICKNASFIDGNDTIH